MTSTSKRVILRIRVRDICDQGSDDHFRIITAYLTFSGQSSANIYDKHGIHLEPIQSSELNQTSCHIILDMNKHNVTTPNLQEISHEIYRVRKREGVL